LLNRRFLYIFIISIIHYTFPSTSLAQASPTVTSFSPTSGSVSFSIVINGSGFDPVISNNMVTFNGLTATVTYADPNKIIATVPNGASTGLIVVTVAGQSAQSLTNFIVLPQFLGISVTSGTVGSTITFNGTGFNDPNPTHYTVGFYGASTMATAVTNTLITFNIPLGAGTGTITLTINGQAVSVPQFQFQIIPIITGVIPNSGAAYDTIVIHGTGFDPRIGLNIVIFSNNVVSNAPSNPTALAVTDTTVTFLVPAYARTGQVFAAIANNLQSETSASFTVLPEINSFNPTSYLRGSYNQIVINCTGFDAGTKDTVIFYPNIQVPYSNKIIIPQNTQTGLIKIKVGNQIITSKTNLLVYNDTIPPTIGVRAPTKVSVDSSSNYVMEINIYDNSTLKTGTLYYRSISDQAWKTRDLSSYIQTYFPSSQSDYASSLEAQVVMDNSWYGAMGLEYYVIATDRSNNETRSPANQSEYFYIKLINTFFTLPNIPFGTSQSNYRIISFPYRLGATTSANVISTIFGNVFENPYNGEIFKYDPSNKESNNNGYLPYSSKQFETIEPGAGYWILTREKEKAEDLHDIAAPNYNKTNLYKLALQPKWNLIGNPYPVNILWSDVLLLNNNGNIHNLNLFSGGWSVADTLHAYSGGFVYNSGTTVDTLLIPFLGQQQIGGRKINPGGSDISSDSWNLFVHTTQGSDFNNLGGFGMNPLAISGVDQFDNFNPPGLGNSPEVNFSHTEFPGLNFSNDIVKTADEYVWRFTVRGNGGEAIILNWNNNISTSGQHLILFDEINLTLTDMYESDHYLFSPQNKNRFSIYFGHNINIMPDILKVSNAYPNPLQFDRTMCIDLGLPDSPVKYSVSYQLYNSAGFEVDSQSCSIDSGLQKLKFPLGKQLTSGLYFYQLIINTSDASNSFSGKIIIP